MTLKTAKKKLWICKCKIQWEEKERCPDCHQTFKGERRKVLNKLGMTKKKQEKKKKNGQDKSKFKKCNGCGGLFEKEYCPDCGIQLVVVTIVEIAVINRSFEENSYS